MPPRSWDRRSRRSYQSTRALAYPSRCITRPGPSLWIPPGSREDPRQVANGADQVGVWMRLELGPGVGALGDADDHAAARVLAFEEVGGGVAHLGDVRGVG